MIQLYLLDCSPLADEQKLERVLPLLNAYRQNKVNRMEVLIKKAQSAATGLLIHYLFGNAEIKISEHGKPNLADRNDTYFSVSHSGHQVICAVADSEIGVDIQPVSSICRAVLKRCFTEAEQDWIDEEPDRFIRLWTMKEAVMKLTGSGFSVPANKIVLPIPPINGYDSQNECWWHLSDWDAPVSLCCRKEDSVIQNIITIKDLL